MLRGQNLLNNLGYIARGRRAQANEFISESRLRLGTASVPSKHLLGRVPDNVMPRA